MPSDPPNAGSSERADAGSSERADADSSERTDDEAIDQASEETIEPNAYEADYCPRCGTETSEKVIDRKPRCWCPECDVVHWRAAVPVIGVAVVDDDRVLTFYHPRTGLFDLPSGHQELPESAPETAARELVEETNLSVDPGDLEIFDVTVKQHPLGRYNFSTTYVVDAARTSGTVEPETDADVVEWTTPTEARTREDEFVPGVVEVLERAVTSFDGESID